MNCQIRASNRQTSWSRKRGAKVRVKLNLQKLYLLNNIIATISYFHYTFLFSLTAMSRLMFATYVRWLSAHFAFIAEFSTFSLLPTFVLAGAKDSKQAQQRSETSTVSDSRQQTRATRTESEFWTFNSSHRISCSISFSRRISQKLQKV